MAVAGGFCPGCGAPIEFSIGQSVAKVCDYCRSTVYRTDRGLQDLGKVSAPANVPSLIAVGDEGTIAGRRMRVLGRVQLDQGEGAWDEWYIALDNGTSWAWLAYAEGTWFVTSLVLPAPAVPPFASMHVERDVNLGASGGFRVGEVKTGRIVSAEGELPARFPEGQPRSYADLHAPGNRYATIDYGTGAVPVEVYVGARLLEPTLQVTGQGPRTRAKVPLAAMRCPSCGGDVPKLAGDRIQRVACRYCGAVTDIESQRVVAAQDAASETPPIPLGARGRLGEVEYVCIAYLRRSSLQEGERYTWEEQLLFAPGVGFRWLVCDEGTWLFVDAVSVADLDLTGMPRRVLLGGQAHTLRNSSEARVDYVLGEVYWRCEVGEAVAVSDFVSGRVVLSREQTPGEVRWSRSVPIPWPVLAKAFGVDVSRSPPPPDDDGPTTLGQWITIVGFIGVCIVIVMVVTALQRSGIIIIPVSTGGGSTYGGSGTYYGGK
jgi:hypothetical protein